MLNTFSIERPHRNVKNWTTTVLNIDGPYSDGEYMLETTNRYEDSMQISLTREELGRLRDWIDEELKKPTP